MREYLKETMPEVDAAKLMMKNEMARRKRGCDGNEKGGKGGCANSFMITVVLNPQP